MRELTKGQFDIIIDYCRQLFLKKNQDYGTSWRILRLSSITDQIYIKALRIRSIQEKGVQKIDEDISDEFDATALNEDKWHIQGKGGLYHSNFIGRPPSQFSTDNVRIEDGKLKIQTRWEPNYPFSPTHHPSSGEAFENITTAAVIGNKHFRYGYMEIKCKSANAPITSSFWTTSNTGEVHKSELDMFEMFGGHKTSEAWRKRLKLNIISWDNQNPYYQPTYNGPTYSDNIQVNHNTADDFHVYGFEWSPEYIKVYVDGVLHPDGDIMKDLVTLGGTDNDRWITDVPYKIWFDSETFPWLGLPTASDLVEPAEYQIEYIRVWQKS